MGKCFHSVEVHFTAVGHRTTQASDAQSCFHSGTKIIFDFSPDPTIMDQSYSIILTKSNNHGSIL